nr:RAMP superfamily CRISPR-associated protein [Chloroflexus sp.]
MTTYKRQRFLFMTTDPVHIGAGGYRLGRVDNSIVREPGTRIPKIPGTSLHGAARSYAAQLYGTPEAAGQSQDKVDNPDKNPVCYTFGYLKKTRRNGDEEDTVGYSGVVNVFDAQVLLFPVHSMAGPVWVSTVSRLNDAGFGVSEPPANWATDAALLT